MFFRMKIVLLTTLIVTASNSFAGGASYLFETRMESSQTWRVKFQDGYTLVTTLDDKVRAENILKQASSRQAVLDQFGRLDPFHKRLILSVIVQFYEGLNWPAERTLESPISFFKEILQTLSPEQKQDVYRSAYVQSVFNFTGMKPQNIESILRSAANNDPQVELSLTCYAMSVVGFYYRGEPSEAETAEYGTRVENVISNIRGLLALKPYLRSGRCNQAFYDKGYYNFSIGEILERAAKSKAVKSRPL